MSEITTPPCPTCGERFAATGDMVALLGALKAWRAEHEHPTAPAGDATSLPNVMRCPECGRLHSPSSACLPYDPRIEALQDGASCEQLECADRGCYADNNGEPYYCRASVATVRSGVRYPASPAVSSTPERKPR